MTLSIAWLRTLTRDVGELVFCSDSRLSGGNRFDHAPKLFVLPRSDCALAFAGGTYWAYPMATAVARATELHEPAATRAMELRQYLSHLCALLNQMQAAVHTYSGSENVPDVTFLFGGWDWIGRRFRLWRLTFDLNRNTFVAHERRSSNGFGRLGLIEFAGDERFIAEARAKLRRFSQERYGKDMRGGSFDLEPFKVLCEMLREAKPSDTIGGAPQVMKVYQHTNARIQGVYWPGGKKCQVYYSGRPLLGYERANGLWILDPKTLRTSAMQSMGVAASTDDGEGSPSNGAIGGGGDE